MSAQAGQNYANQVSSNLGYAGNAQAAGYANSANAWANGLNQIGNNFGQMYQGQQQAQNFAASNPIAPAPTLPSFNFGNAGLGNSSWLTGVGP